MLVPITLALAETKTIERRIEEKHKFITTYLTRPANRVDPLNKEGGSEEAVRRELQSIRDLEERLVVIRLAIADANAKTSVTVEGTTRTVAGWLAWKREVAPREQILLRTMRETIDNDRKRYTGTRQVTYGVNSSQPVVTDNPDIVVTMSETELAKSIENLEKTLGGLDGQLSLINATVQVDI